MRWLLAPLLLCSACVPDQSARPLRIGLNPWPGYLDLAVAKAEGYFEAEGLQVQIVEFASLHDAVRAYENGQIDIMPCTLVEVREANRGPRRAEVVRVFDASEGPDVVLAHASVDEQSPAGTRVAYEPDSLGAYVLQRFLEMRGLSFRDVEPVPMDQLQMARAMAERRIDAAVTYPPTSLEIAELDGVRPVFTSASIPGEIVDVLAVDPALLDADPQLLERLYGALSSAEQFAAEEPERAIAIKAAALRVDPATWEEITKGLRIYRSADQIDWLWRTDRLQRLMRQIDDVLSVKPEEPQTTAFSCRLRPMPRLRED